MPMLAVGSMKKASSVQKTRSHGHTIRWPPPMHPPCTAAMVGFMTELDQPDLVPRREDGAPGGAGCGSLRLAPTQKCLPFALHHDARESSVFARCQAPWNSTWNASSYAFTGDGRA